MKLATDQKANSARLAGLWPCRGLSLDRRIPHISIVICAMAVLLAAPALSAAADITTGLVAYYPLNGNALDVSGNGRDGTIIGASATSDRYGNSNAAMGFDGNDYIVASAAGLPTVERTVSLWFLLNTIPSRPGSVLFAYGGCGCPTTWFEYVIPGTAGVFPHCNGGMFCNYAVSTGVWYHLVFTASSPGGTAMYVNGQFVCSSPVVLNTCTNAGTQLAIGVCVNAWAGQAPFTNVDVDYTNGAIDEVRIYDRALSATEVLALFDFNPTATDPVTWGAIKALYR